ncbi:MAG: sugar transferase, partial [Elusimicrobiaceae bacterium]|nr:sugar transferase [Elusimicrobiaceae bacterium]
DYVHSHALVRNIPLFAVVFLLASFVLWLFSFYDVKQLRKRKVSYKMLLVAWAVCLFGSASMIYFTSEIFNIPTPKRLLLAIVTLYYIYIYIFRRNYFKLDFVKKNVLIFGQSETITALVKELKSARGFRVRDYEPAPAESKHYSVKNLDLVITGSKLFKESPTAWDIISKQFISKGIVVDTDFNVYENVSRRVPRESIEDSIWLLRGIGSRHEHRIYHTLKRVFDFGAACVLIPFLLPLCGLIWIFIRWVDKCDPVFKQKRVGVFGTEFTIYKFRTISPKTQESENETLTRTGKFLRRFRLDELLQLYNVLRGDLSFVGPRPLWVGEASILDENIPNHNIRTIAKPGITGWAQLNFKAPPNYKTRNGNQSLEEKRAFEAAFTRLSYDVWYIKNRSIMLDIEIMVKTVIRMFIKDSRVS